MHKLLTLLFPTFALGVFLAFFNQALISQDLPIVISPATAPPGSTITVTGQGLEAGAKAVVWGQNVVINNLPLPGYTWDVAQSGNHLYVASGLAGLTVLDTIDPRNPALVSNTPLQGDTRIISVSGNHAYLGTLSNGLYIVDISNPSTPQVVSNIATFNSVLDIKVSGSYVYMTTGNYPVAPATLNQLGSLVFYAPLNDHLLGRTGTDIELRSGAGKLTLCDVSSGNLNIPSASFSIENDFGSTGGSLIFPGGTSGGPVIYGNQADFKPYLNFGDSPAIVALWIDGDTNVEKGVMISGGPHGPISVTRGGWSIFDGGIGKVSFAIGRRNHPQDPDCTATSSLSTSMPLITDGKKHFIVVVYDTINDEMYIYTDGRKNPVRKLNGCRADSEGDDNYPGPGTDKEWLSIGEAGQGWNGDIFYDGTIQDIYIFKPLAIPDNIDSIILEWYTLGSPGPKAAQAL